MRNRTGWASVAGMMAVIGVAVLTSAGAMAQANSRVNRGGFVPGQQRPDEDPARVERGKTLYGIQCNGCHGADLRGGDMGGPNLLRSQEALADKQGEHIVPIIQGSRQDGGMPAIRMSPEDAGAVAAYVRSVVETIGGQGRPPSVGVAAPTVLVGNAAAGQAYFDARCARCHSPAGDLQGIATRLGDAKALQNAWVSGGGGRSRNPAPNARAAQVTVSITPADGEKIEGALAHIDDFLVTVRMADDSLRSFYRNGDRPKVEVHDPRKAHTELLPILTDKDMHDVTAYLETLR